MQVAKWGNSLAIRLPVSVVETLDLHAGDDIEIVVAEPKTFQVSKKKQFDDFWQQLDTLPKLPADFIFNRDEANEQ